MCTRIMNIFFIDINIIIYSDIEHELVLLFYRTGTVYNDRTHKKNNKQFNSQLVLVYVCVMHRETSE